MGIEQMGVVVQACWIGRVRQTSAYFFQICAFYTADWKEVLARENSGAEIVWSAEIDDSIDFRLQARLFARASRLPPVLNLDYYPIADPETGILHSFNARKSA